MKRISIYFLFGISVVTFVTFFDFYFTSQSWKKWYYTEFFAKANHLDGKTRDARMIYKGTHSLTDIRDYFNDQLLGGNMSYWLLFENGKIVDSSFGKVPLDELTERMNINLQQAPNSVFESEDHVNFYAVSALDETRHVVAGSYFDTDAYLASMAKRQREALALYLAGLLLVCLGTFAFFFRDIMRSVRAIGSQRGARPSRLMSFSKEADLLARGIAAFDQQSASLQKDKDLFRWQVLPSLRSELESGQKPPYDFACTLVRTDINNYTRIYNEFPVADFATTINDFFTDVTHIASRYGGFVHEFIGDEVICYFKDEGSPNSVAMAMAAVRDINRAAAKHHDKTLKERGYPFTVKSSLAHDRLRFAPLVNGFGLSGPSLVETVRVLSNVTEKDGSVLVCDERHQGMSDQVARFEFSAEVVLKGFNHSKRLFIERGFANVESCCNWSDARAISRLAYFRDDVDLAHILNWAALTWAEAPVIEVQKLIVVLRTFTVTRSSGAPEAALLSWLTDLLKNDALSDERMNILASALRLIENLVVHDDKIAPFEQLLKEASRLADRRVVANALDVLKTLNPVDRDWAKDLAQHSDNRVSANALVHEGLREITPFVVKKLRRMLHSKNALHVSSGAYAIGEIAAYHNARDPVYFKTQVNFLRLFSELSLLAFHEDVRVRRQALVAAIKVGDVDVIAEIERRLATSENADDAKTALGWAA